MTKAAQRAGVIPPQSSLTPYWQPEANFNAVPMQITVIVMRQICRGKGHSPHPCPLKHSHVTAG